MKQSIRQHWLAISVVIVAAAAVAACGQITTSEEAPQGAVKASKLQPRASLTVESVCANADDPECTPTGAHAKHTSTCAVCHAVAGRLAFQVGGPAYGAGWTSSQPRPAFDPVAKTCSNVACHGVPAGTYSYYFPGNEMDADGYPIPELKTVSYGGTMSAATPSWYATGSATCTACHGNPPANGSDGSNAWHSGNHANNQNVGPTPPNACELCHNLPSNVNSPIVQSVNGAGTVILQPGFHATGAVNVNARFRSQCFGCH